jgi:hypothetical protein
MRIVTRARQAAGNQNLIVLAVFNEQNFERLAHDNPAV